MCGIVGVIGRPVEKPIINNMVNALEHRGPDDSGIWIGNRHHVTLGHRRLTIIDLSEKGHQPMFSVDNKLVITYNGEIYNFREIRSDLENKGCIFRSESDTEVLLYAYREWGINMLQRLRGMFAFAIWDEVKGELFAARDRLGIKPLFYTETNGYMAFASEIKAILKLDNFKPNIDDSAFYDFLTYMYIPAPKTNYKEIKKLKAGHYLKCDSKGNVNVSQYWDINPEENKYIDKEKINIELSQLLQESIKYRMVSDVPISFFLSGGIDSSTVVGLAAQHGTSPLNTFTIGFDHETYDERIYAHNFSDRYNTNHHEKELTLHKTNDIMDRVIHHFDEPNGDSSLFPVFYVTEFASQKYKVAISGTGGDEVFNGYNWFNTFDTNIHNPLRKLLSVFGLSNNIQNYFVNSGYGPRRQFINNEIELYIHLKGGFTMYEKQNLLNKDFVSKFSDYDDYWYFKEYWKPELDPFTRVQYLELKTYLPENILTIMDRMSMMHSLEVRVPLLDHKIVEYVFSLTPNARPFGKRLLTDAAGNIIDNEIIKRKKKGFSSPLQIWYPSKSKKISDGFICDEENICKFGSFKQHFLNVFNHYYKI